VKILWMFGSGREARNSFGDGSSRKDHAYREINTLIGHAITGESAFV